MSVGSRIGEGLVEKAEIASGAYLANSLVKVNNGHVITSILNTREQDVELPNPVVNPSAWCDGHCPHAARSHSFVYISTS